MKATLLIQLMQSQVQEHGDYEVLRDDIEFGHEEIEEVAFKPPLSPKEYSILCTHLGKKRIKQLEQTGYYLLS